MSDASRAGGLTKWPIVAVESAVMAQPDALDGEQIRRAREAKRMTQRQLAEALGVGVRTIGRWERDEAIPRSALGAIREILNLTTGEDADGGPPLRHASEAELLAELARRMEAAKRRNPEPTTSTTGRYRMRKSKGPMATVDSPDDQRKRDRDAGT